VSSISVPISCWSKYNLRPRACLSQARWVAVVLKSSAIAEEFFLLIKDEAEVALKQNTQSFRLPLCTCVIKI